MQHVCKQAMEPVQSGARLRPSKTSRSRWRRRDIGSCSCPIAKVHQHNSSPPPYRTVHVRPGIGFLFTSLFDPFRQTWTQLGSKHNGRIKIKMCNCAENYPCNHILVVRAGHMVTLKGTNEVVSSIVWITTCVDYYMYGLDAHSLNDYSGYCGRKINRQRHRGRRHRPPTHAIRNKPNTRPRQKSIVDTSNKTTLACLGRRKTPIDDG